MDETPTRKRRAQRPPRGEALFCLGAPPKTSLFGKRSKGQGNGPKEAPVGRGGRDVAKSGVSAGPIHCREVEKELPGDIMATVESRLLAGNKPPKGKPLLDLYEYPQAGPAKPAQVSGRPSIRETLKPPNPDKTASPKAPSVKASSNGTPLRPQQKLEKIPGLPTQMSPPRLTQKGKAGSKPTGTAACV
jgi:hypothetical protein